MTNNQDHSWLYSLMGSHNPSGEVYSTEVSIDLDSPLLLKYIEVEFNYVSSLSTSVPFTFEQFQQYVTFLVICRVNYVNGVQTIISPTDRVVVPSFLSLLLGNIGKCFDTKLGIQLTPTIHNDVQPSDWIVQNWYVISNFLFSLRNSQYQFSLGYERDRNGSYDYMSMHVVLNCVRNESDKPHPAYALMAATLNLTHSRTVFFPRYNYGSVDDLQHFLVQVVVR